MRFIGPEQDMQLAIYVDAAHGTDIKTRCSVSGVIATLNGTAIAYRAIWQPTISTSLTEAEFIAAVTAGKISSHLRYILDEIGIDQTGPTAIYEDNAAAILMANAGKPTERSRRIDIQYFSLQEWAAKGLVNLFHIPGVDITADSITKALGWVLHTIHITRLMGHCGTLYTTTSGHKELG